MINLFQVVYDTTLLCINAFAVSFALKRKIPYFLCAVVFLVSPVVIELAFEFAPPFAQAALVKRALKGLVLLPLIVIVFKGKFFQKTFVFFILMSLAVLFNLVSGLGARLFFAAGPGYERCRYFAAWGLLVLYFFLFLRFGREPAGNLFAVTDKLNWFLHTLGACFSYLSLQTADAAFQQGNFRDASLINILIALGNLFVIFTAISATAKSAGESYELRLAKEVIASGADYYKRLDRILREIRVLRHDYKYQIGVIDELAKISKARHIRDFLADARSYYSQTEPVVYCENFVVSALLANYAGRFEKNNISFKIRAVLPVEIPHVDKSLSPLDNYEICIVLGNLLENAFEGTMRVPAAQRRVSLEIRLASGKLLVEEKNTFDGRIISGDGQASSSNIPQSRKGTGGGYGLRSIAAVCKRHSGEYLPEWTGSEYTIRLLLNL
ncbi:MAG: GHKL domain-containing protein [Treponema sp.]|jgi:hypothetical protein|nr:GHKL domain-containing protein [Treponema sp.]